MNSPFASGSFFANCMHLLSSSSFSKFRYNEGCLYSIATVLRIDKIFCRSSWLDPNFNLPHSAVNGCPWMVLLFVAYSSLNVQKLWLSLICTIWLFRTMIVWSPTFLHRAIICVRARVSCLARSARHILSSLVWYFHAWLHDRTDYEYNTCL